MQQTLIGIGMFFVVLGLLWPLVQKSSLDRLSGDIVIKKDGFLYYFPITTVIIISVVITVIIWLEFL